MPRKKKKEKKAKKKLWLNEKDTLSYEQQIVDNNRQLERLRTRNDELELELDTLKSNIRQLEEDRSDVIAHLRRTLEEKLEESKELNERLVALEEVRKEETILYKKREDQMEIEYRNMENTLNAEVKLAAGKLSALEDWRVSRLDLINKFEEQEKRFEEQEKRNKDMLYEAERALIIGKAKMQEEMQQRLHELADKVRSATQIRIADATHRAIKENIALNQEMDAIFKVCNDLEIQNSEYIDKERTLRLESELHKAETDIVMNKVLKQREQLNELAQNYIDMNTSYAKLYNLRNKVLQLEALIENYKQNSINNEKKMEEIRNLIQTIKEKNHHVIDHIRVKCKEYDRLYAILVEVKDSVMAAVRLQEELTINNCTCHQAEIKDDLLKTLFDILSKYTLSKKKITERIMNEIDAEKCLYESGHLGLLKDLQLCDYVKFKEECLERERAYEEEEEGEEELEEEEPEVIITPTLKIPICVESIISSEILSPQEVSTTESAESILSIQDENGG